MADETTKPDRTEAPPQEENGSAVNGATKDASGQAGNTATASGETAKQSFPVDQAATGNGSNPDEPQSSDVLVGSGVSIEPGAEEYQVPALSYPVVGFGASAGGLTAFREILENLDVATGMAFILVTHLSPDHKSYLTEIIERHTRMPVSSVVHGERPAPNHIYILLPNQLLRLREGAFHVEERSRATHGPLVIDTFFRSLAAEQKNHAIGVVLSGADSDGASGLRAIKGEGGIALVQSPGSAVQPGMPRSSIAADHVDMVIPPAEIAVELGRLAVQFARPEVRSLEEGDAEPDDERAFQRILQLLRTVSSLELRQYKPETLRRRMARRLVLHRQQNLTEYYKFLQIRPDELRQLQEDLLINVTRFFRDPAFWESLRENVLPTLMQDRNLQRPIRVWCAGCSSGEEAYSLAISVMEYLYEKNLDVPVQIFGTDASEQSIEMARAAVYPESLADEISPERLRRFFVKIDRGYQVSKRLRDACIFARQNLSNDPPFSHIDILSCRNVMIYFNLALQRQVMVTFHYALDPGGYMLLGMSEGLRDYTESFNTVDRKNKIYMKAGTPLPRGYDQPRSYAISPNAGPVRVGGTGVQDEMNTWPELELQRAADRIVLARFGPPGLIVDEQLNVLQSRGQTGSLLKIAPGSVSWNLMRVLKEGLAGETRSALQRSIQENIPATATAKFVDNELGEQTIQIDVLPITGATARMRCFLVLFQAAGNTAAINLNDSPTPANLTLDEKERMIAQVRQELNSTRFHLQSLVEERDARHQELVSANEEIQSANEELQSTNEELETTKEELQSANEELQTVNDELQQRNNTLTQTGNDLTNLLNSVNVPLLMLTSDLRIRQFTPPMQRLLSVRAADIGRSINEIRLQLSIADIEPILHEVLDTLGTREIEVQDRDGRWFLLRVRPYRTTDNKIEGLVVVLLDIDQLRRSQEQLVDAHQFAGAVIEGVPVPIVVLSKECTIRTANTAFRDLAEMDAKELEGRSLPDLVKKLSGIESMGERLEGLLTTPGTRFQFEQVSQRKTLLINGLVLGTDGDRVLLLMFENITERRDAEHVVSEQKHVLEGEVAVANRQLDRTQEELRGLSGHLFNAQEEERQSVARELHDGVSQKLSLIATVLQEIFAEPNAKADTAKIEQARAMVQNLNTDVRAISHQLHPAILDDLGLAEALRILVEDFGKQEGMPATYLGRNLPELKEQPAVTAIYRITQEALSNVAKHAGVTHVKVILEAGSGKLRLEVRDLGLGFDESALPRQGLGLISMKERARLAHGTLSVRSARGEGTTVTLDVPFEAGA